MKKDILRIVFVVTIVALASRGNTEDSVGDSRGAETKSPTSMTFSLSGVNYIFTIPRGFCTTSGKDSEFAAAIASLDPKNMTHFTVIPCEEAGSDSGFTKWGILKTPRGSIGKRIPTRQQWVEDVKKSIKRRDFVELFDDVEQLVGKTYKDLFGDDAEVGMHMEMVDADEHAGYMTGTALVDVAGRKELTAMAGALTVVRGNIFFYYKYESYNDLSDLADLIKQVKPEIRRFVKDNPD